MAAKLRSKKQQRRLEYAPDAFALLNELVDDHFNFYCAGTEAEAEAEGSKVRGPVKDGECICARAHQVLLEAGELREQHE